MSYGIEILSGQEITYRAVFIDDESRILETYHGYAGLPACIRLLSRSTRIFVHIVDPALKITKELLLLLYESKPFIYSFRIDSRIFEVDAIEFIPNLFKGDGSIPSLCIQSVLLRTLCSVFERHSLDDGPDRLSIHTLEIVSSSCIDTISLNTLTRLLQVRNLTLTGVIFFAQPCSYVHQLLPSVHCLTMIGMANDDLYPMETQEQVEHLNALINSCDRIVDLTFAIPNLYGLEEENMYKLTSTIVTLPRLISLTLYLTNERRTWFPYCWFLFKYATRLQKLKLHVPYMRRCDVAVIREIALLNEFTYVYGDDEDLRLRIDDEINKKEIPRRIRSLFNFK